MNAPYLSAAEHYREAERLLYEADNAALQLEEARRVEWIVTATLDRYERAERNALRRAKIHAQLACVSKDTDNEIWELNRG